MEVVAQETDLEPTGSLESFDVEFEASGELVHDSACQTHCHPSAMAFFFTASMKVCRFPAPTQMSLEKLNVFGALSIL
jgi:hypothetical protein